MILDDYALPSYPNIRLGTKSLHISTLVAFLEHVLARDDLEIRDFLPAMKQEPFFLIAATGLGKTVAVPIHLLIRTLELAGGSPDPRPRVWIVEPRISIATEQTTFMNFLWNEFGGLSGERGFAPLFGSISSATGRVNPRAPIQFITTGLLWLLAQDGTLTPGHDRVVIDEAHVTLEQGADVEIAVAYLRSAGVVVDFMSATVATEGLEDALGALTVIRADPQRHVVWKHNLGRPVEEVLPEVVDATLVDTDLRSEFFPRPGAFHGADEVLAAVTEPARSHGLLVVINSFAGDHSDARRLGNALARHYPTLEVLSLAGEVVRNPRRLKAFSDDLARIEKAGINYVILATSVVEMGITFPTLDYVLTLDSGYEQEVANDVVFPVVLPLGVNALMQRVGRVGRRRPGVAYISREVGASYAELDDIELNGAALDPQPIRFPVAAGSLALLAYLACAEGVKNVKEWVGTLSLPSHPERDEALLAALEKRIVAIKVLDLADADGLTPLGDRVRPWLGRMELAMAVQLEHALEAGGLPEFMFWLVTASLGSTSAISLRARKDFFVDYEGVHSAIPHAVEVWQGWSDESLACFAVICTVAELFPSVLFSTAQGGPLETEVREAYRWCALAGIDGRTLLRNGRSIREVWSKYYRGHSSAPIFADLSRGGGAPDLRSLSWVSFVREIASTRVQDVLARFPDWSRVTLAERDAGLAWKEIDGERSGLIRQDDSPVRLQGGREYYGRLQPTRAGAASELAWRLAQLGGPCPPRTGEGKAPNPAETREAKGDAFRHASTIQKSAALQAPPPDRLSDGDRTGEYYQSVDRPLGPQERRGTRVELTDQKGTSKAPAPSESRPSIYDLARELQMPAMLVLTRLRSAGFRGLSIRSRVDGPAALRALTPDRHLDPGLLRQGHASTATRSALTSDHSAAKRLPDARQRRRPRHPPPARATPPSGGLLRRLVRALWTWSFRG